jgi:hypothetical protein
MKTFICAVAVSLLLLQGSARGESRRDLERDIAALKAQIAQRRPVVEGLSQPWHRGTSLHFGFAAAPFVSLVQELNAFPEDQRTIHASVYEHGGQLWGWDAGCVFGGNEGRFVEFKDPNYRVEANVRLSNFSAAWVPNQGLQFGMHASGHVGIGTMHWHIDPCFGGGFGGDAGPASCDAAAQLSSLSAMALGADNVLRYNAAINLNSIRYGCSISFGDIGDLQIPQLVSFPTNVSFSGAMPLPISTSGVLASPHPDLPLRKEYDMRLAGPALRLTNEGVEVGTNVQLVWR